MQLDEIHSFAMAKTKHTQHRYYSTEEEEEVIKKMEKRKKKKTEEEDTGDTEGPEGHKKVKKVTVKREMNQHLKRGRKRRKIQRKRRLNQM